MKLIKNNKEIALIKISYEDEVDKISQKGLNRIERYIKLEKGPNKTMTIFDEKNIPIHSFDVAESGATLFSKNIKNIRNKTLDFLCSKGINPNIKTNEVFEEIIVFPPQKGLSPGGEVYNIHIGGEHAIFILGFEKVNELFGNIEKKEYFASDRTGTVSFSVVNKNINKLPDTSGIN